MSEETTVVGIRGEWQDLLRPLACKPPGLEHLEPIWSKLETVLDRTNVLIVQQSALASSRQVISKELRELIDIGQRQAALLRKALKAHFGPRAEELTAFGLQPFRGLKAKAKVEVGAKAGEKLASGAEGATSAADPSTR